MELDADGRTWDAIRNTGFGSFSAFKTQQRRIIVIMISQWIQRAVIEAHAGLSEIWLSGRANLTTLEYCQTDDSLWWN